MSSLTSDLARLANNANVLISAITTNSSAITSINVGGVAINSSGLGGGPVTFSNNVTISGNLIVTGTTVTVNTTTLDVKDLNITVAKGASSNSAANGAGITVDSANAQIYYSSNSWNTNLGLNIFGNLGVGLPVPSEKLHVYNDSANSFVAIDTGGLGGSKRWNVGVQYSNSSLLYPYFGFCINDGYNANNVFYIDWNTYNTYLVPVKGNVGIGTTSPATKLDVHGANGYVVGRINATDGSLSRIQLQNTNRNWSISNYGSQVSPYGALVIADETAGSARMAIDTSGNIGFGIVNPTFNAGSGVRVHRTSGSTLSLTDASSTFDLMAFNTHSYLSNRTSGHIYFETSSSTNMSICANGNVGINTTSPTTKLEVYNTANSGHLTLSADDNGLADQTRIDLDFMVRNQGHRIARISSRYITSANTGEGELRFFTKTQNSALTQQMYITGDGQVRVGANSGINSGKIHSYAAVGYQAYTAQVAANVYSLFQGFSSAGVMSFQVQGDGTTAITGGVTGQGLTMGRDGATGGGYIQAEYSGTGTLSFLTSSTTRIQIGATGVITTKGELNIDNNVYSKRIFNGSGNYSASTWYELCNSSNLTQDGIYIIRAYLNTYYCGGGFYDWSYTSVPFFWFTGGTNSTNAFNFPTPMGSGHADNGSTVIFRIRQTAGNTDGKSYVDFQLNNTLTGVDGTAGKIVQFKLHRIG